jgi:hypothetical protein
MREKAISKGIFRHCEFLFPKNKQKKMTERSDRQSIALGRNWFQPRGGLCRRHKMSVEIIASSLFSCRRYETCIFPLHVAYLRHAVKPRKLFSTDIPSLTGLIIRRSSSVVFISGEQTKETDEGAESNSVVYRRCVQRPIRILIGIFGIKELTE